MRKHRRAAFRLQRIIPMVAGSLAMYWLFIRPWHLRWGATGEDVRRLMPGDDIVAEPGFSATRAVSIEASAAEVWLWLCESGSVDAGRIAPGGTLLIGNTRYAIEAVEANRSLRMAIRNPHATVSYGVMLDEINSAQTRLLVRTRASVHADMLGVLFLLALDAWDFVKLRRQMLNIKQLAEQHYLSRVPAPNAV